MEKNKLGDFVEVTVAFPSNRRGPGVGPIENCTISVNLRKSYALNPSGPVGSHLGEYTAKPNLPGLEDH